MKLGEIIEQIEKLEAYIHVHVDELIKNEITYRPDIGVLTAQTPVPFILQQAAADMCFRLATTDFQRPHLSKASSKSTKAFAE